MNLKNIILGCIPVVGKVVKKLESGKQTFVRGNVSMGAVKKVKAVMEKNWKSVAGKFLPAPALIQSGKELLEKAGIHPNTCYSNDPVNLATGNLVNSVEDITTNGKFAISFSRFYNAIDQFEGLIGRNWHCNYDVQLRRIDENSIVILFEDGRKEYFYDKDGCYQSSANSNSILAAHQDQTFTLRLAYGELNFNSDGKITSKFDLFNHKTSFEYQEDLLVKISNRSGFLTFCYNDKGYISVVEDHSKRKVKFEYDRGNLIRVEDVNGYIHQYDYYKNGLLKEIRNPLDISIVTNYYDESGRTVKQSFPDGEKMYYHYDDIHMKTILKERNGEHIIYHRDKNYQITKVEYSDGSELFKYNENSNLIQYVDKNNHMYCYEYTPTGQCRKETDPLGNITRYDFNSEEVLMGKVCANGAAETYVYNEEGILAEMIGSTGGKDNFSYNEAGNLICYARNGVDLLKIEYDEKDNIVCLTDGEHNKTEYEYDSLGRVIKTILPEGGETEYDYLPSGKVSKITNACGDVMEYIYDGAENIIEEKDFAGNVTKLEYNSLNQPISETDPKGNTYCYLYNEMWDVICETDRNGGETFYEYDGLQRLTAKIDEEGNKTEYSYDPNGNMTRIRNPLGKVKSYEYDALNQIVKHINEEGFETQLYYDAVGNIIRVIDYEGNEIHYEYDLLNQITKVTDAMGGQTSYVYNGMGLVEKVVDSESGTLMLNYNNNGKITEVINQMGNSRIIYYDKNGNIVSFVDYNGEETKYQYDNLNRLIKMTDPFGNSKKYGYDKLGYVTGITDENGNEVTYQYDPIGNLIQVTNENMESIGYTYDPNSNLIGIDRHGVIQHTCFEYDKRNLQVKRTDPDGRSVVYEYDGAGNLIRKGNRGGEETRAEYTDTGLISKIIYSDQSFKEYTYNPLGKLIEVKELAGSLKIKRDANDRVVYTKDRAGKVTQYEYNQVGNTTCIIYPDGYEVNYEYDKSGRMTKVIDGNQGETTYTYGKGPEALEISYPNKWKTSYTYDSLSRLTHQQSRNLYGDVMEDLNYVYDPVGNRIMQVKKEQSEFPAHLFTFTDKEGSVYQDTGVTEYFYDKCSQLIGVTCNQDRTTNYVFDSMGNRVKMEVQAEGGYRTSEYEYDDMNRLLREKTNRNDSFSNETEIKRYLYNGNGDLISVEDSKSGAWKYSYNPSGQMKAAEDQNGKQLEFYYDGIGRRIRTVESSEQKGIHLETNYVFDFMKDSDNVLMTCDEKHNITRFVRGVGLVSQEEAETERKLYYLCDILGSPVRLTDDQGMTEQSYRYDEYGNRYEMNLNKNCRGYMNVYRNFHKDGNSAMGKTKSIFGFTGYGCHENMELYFAQARYYDSHNGRFVQRDSMEYVLMGNVISFQLYGYCENNPVYYIDPLGLTTNEDKNTIAREYVLQKIKKNPKATEDMVKQVLVSNRPEDDAHTIAEILIYEHLVNKMKFKNVKLEVSIKEDKSNISRFIDILAVDANGNAYIYDAKSFLEIKRKGTTDAYNQISRYHQYLACDKNKEIRKSSNIKKLAKQPATPGRPFEETLFKTKKYEVRMKLHYCSNGIYAYEIITYKGRNQDRKEVHQKALKNMLNDHYAELKAQKVFNEALAVAAGTVVALTIAGVTAVLITALASVSAPSTIPALSSYVSGKVPGVICGTSATVMKFKPQIEKALKPIAKEVLKTLKKAS